MLKKISGMCMNIVFQDRFSGDRLDNQTDNLLYSDVTADNRAGQMLRSTTNTNQTDTSIWNLEFDKVTMYKIEFSWYGAVGALFLYVPVGAVKQMGACASFKSI